MNEYSVVFTGGGSAGHVTPNLALIEAMPDWKKFYIGTDGIERELVSKKNIPFYVITSGKLRRYFSWKNFFDPFKVLWAIVQSFFLLGQLKPNIVFSKGGFVAFPVVFAAWCRRIPVIVHESDLTPGLANRMSFPFCRYICVTFSEGGTRGIPQDKCKMTGSPMRESLFKGNAENARQLCGFTAEKKTLLVMAGGQGSLNINQCVRDALPQLLSTYQIIHLCGKDKVDHSISLPGYFQVEYADEHMADFMALADIVISRAGANSLYELLALQKLNLLIPLSKKASRGDQLLNAAYFEKRGLSHVIQDEKLNTTVLLTEISRLAASENEIKQKMSTFPLPESNKTIIELMKSLIR